MGSNLFVRLERESSSLQRMKAVEETKEIPGRDEGGERRERKRMQEEADLVSAREKLDKEKREEVSLPLPSLKSLGREKREREERLQVNLSSSSPFFFSRLFLCFCDGSSFSLFLPVSRFFLCFILRSFFFIHISFLCSFLYLILVLVSASLFPFAGKSYGEHRSLTAGGSYRNSGRHFPLFTCTFICRTGHFQVWYTRNFKSWMRKTREILSFRTKMFMPMKSKTAGKFITLHQQNTADSFRCFARQGCCCIFSDFDFILSSVSLNISRNQMSIFCRRKSFYCQTGCQMRDEKEREKKNNITHKRQLFFRTNEEKQEKHVKEQSLSVSLFFSAHRCISSLFYLTKKKRAKTNSCLKWTLKQMHSSSSGMTRKRGQMSLLTSPRNISRKCFSRDRKWVGEFFKKNLWSSVTKKRVDRK